MHSDNRRGVAMDKKIGVYLCSGCDIGQSIDVEKISKLINTDKRVALCKIHSNLCGKNGIEIIKKDIEQENINAVVIGACSLRVKSEVFSFDPTKILVERVNLREHIAWSQTPQNDDTQLMAEDYIKMGIAKISKASIPTPSISDDIKNTILVVGGGISGMTAAIEAARAGYDVIIVEKEEYLGGNMRNWYKILPKNPPYKDFQDNNIQDTIEKLKRYSNIKVLTSATVQSISGQPGKFDVLINQRENIVSEKIGSIINATGWKPYDASKIEGFGFVKYDNVITNFMFEKMISDSGGKITRPSDGVEPRSVIFIQCAGSRDERYLPYCSSVCCAISLKQSSYIKKNSPKTNVYVIYKDIRTPAQLEEFYKERQHEGVLFMKGDISNILEDQNGSLIVRVENTLIGDSLNIKADMVVLATGMVPNSDEKILGLQYRQGEELPMLKYGFPDSNFICFPYETRRTGIYAAGAIRQPSDSKTCIEDAKGTAAKAIQAMELCEVGAATHPRVGDLSYPIFFIQKCTQCKRCTEECPVGALDEDAKGTPLLNPNRCRRCGICMGACPEKIISFENYSIDMVNSMINEITISEEEEEFKILVFACENDAYPAFDIAGLNRINLNAKIRVIPVRCLGSVNIVWIINALSKGIDGVMLFGCKRGDNYQCHFIQGSELLNKRMENLQEALSRLSIEPERVQVLELAISDYDSIPKMVNSFIENIESIGPNPYRTF
jgi:quinone-modifying oxidoreductase subunit QmoB